MGAHTDPPVCGVQIAHVSQPEGGIARLAAIAARGPLLWSRLEHRPGAVRFVDETVGAYPVVEFHGASHLSRLFDTNLDRARRRES